MTDKRRVHIRLQGIVQGVGMRYYIQNHARRIGIRGYVRNLRDGSVEAVAEGRTSQVDLFLKAIKEDTPGRIDKMEVEDLSSKEDFGAFEVRF